MAVGRSQVEGQSGVSFTQMIICNICFCNSPLNTAKLCWSSTLDLWKDRDVLCLCLLQATPLDKERPVLRRGRHPDVKLPLPFHTTLTTTTLPTEKMLAQPPRCLPGLPTVPLSLSPDTCSDASPSPGLRSDTDDVSISSASTAPSPSSPF